MGKLLEVGEMGDGWDRGKEIADLGAVFVSVSLVPSPPPPPLSLTPSLCVCVHIAWGAVFRWFEVCAQIYAKRRSSHENVRARACMNVRACFRVCIRVCCVYSCERQTKPTIQQLAQQSGVFLSPAKSKKDDSSLYRWVGVRSYCF